jgi:hypothetical protein
MARTTILVEVKTFVDVFPDCAPEVFVLAPILKAGHPRSRSAGGEEHQRSINAISRRQSEVSLSPIYVKAQMFNEVPGYNIDSRSCFVLIFPEQRCAFFRTGGGGWGDGARDQLMQ